MFGISKQLYPELPLGTRLRISYLSMFRVNQPAWFFSEEEKAGLHKSAILLTSRPLSEIKAFFDADNKKKLEIAMSMKYHTLCLDHAFRDMVQFKDYICGGWARDRI
jgi:hypothetical protein